MLFQNKIETFWEHHCIENTTMEISLHEGFRFLLSYLLTNWKFPKIHNVEETIFVVLLCFKITFPTYIILFTYISPERPKKPLCDPIALTIRQRSVSTQVVAITFWSLPANLPSLIYLNNLTYTHLSLVLKKELRMGFYVRFKWGWGQGWVWEKKQFLKN